MEQARRKDWVFFGIFWVLFTVIGEFLAFKVHLFPSAVHAKEAELSDDAYLLLVKMGVPIFAGVAACLLTIFVRHVDHRFGTEPPTEDGEHVVSHKGFTPAWIGLSAALCLVLVWNPGFVGLRDMRGSSSADMVVAVRGQQWSWRFTYEGGQVATDELVLPAHERIRFDITSIDVIHSFWVPAFRVKLSNVPGRTTQMYITTEEEGDGATDPTLRVQCNELCGQGHAAMKVPVRIVSKAEFETWLASQKKGA